MQKRNRIGTRQKYGEYVFMYADSKQAVSPGGAFLASPEAKLKVLI